MKEIITELQKKEIEALAENHLDALVAYGGDMYRQGLTHGCKWTVIGMFIGAGVCIAADCIIKHKKSKKEQNEES